MPSLRTFTTSELEQICRALGEAVSGGQLAHCLADAGVPARSAVGSTKWRRLVEDVGAEQRRTGNGDSVLRVIGSVMAPVRFTSDHEKFEKCRSDLNRVLAFTGLELARDGSLVAVRAAATLTEAEGRAVALHEKLAERGVHADVLAACRAELLEEDYFHTVLEATKSLGEKIRRRTGLDGDGAELADAAFGLGRANLPALAFNRLDNRNERSEHTGLHHLIKGVFGAFRNPTAHALRTSWPLEEADALDLLQTISLLHRRLDAAHVTQAAPNYAVGPS